MKFNLSILTLICKATCNMHTYYMDSINHISIQYGWSTTIMLLAMWWSTSIWMMVIFHSWIWFHSFGYIHPCIEFHPCSTFRNHMGMMIIWGFVWLMLSSFINWQPLCLPFHLSIFFLFTPLSTSSHLFHSWFCPLGSPFSLPLPKVHPFMWLVYSHICSSSLFCM